MKNVLLKCAMALAIICVCQSITAQEISSFTLINAKDDIELGMLSEGDTINISDVNTAEFSIRANTSGEVGSIVFHIDNDIVNTESSAPYALLKNVGDDYLSWVPELRTYSVTSSVYSLPQGKGVLLDSYGLTITFEDTIVVQPKGPDVLSLVLVNADTDEDIATITEGAVFVLEEIGTDNLNIRAEVDSLTESVVFDYQQVKNYHTENLPLYAIGANDDDDYRPWNPDLGANSLTVTAYTKNKGAGLAGDSMTVNFEIIEDIPVVIPSFVLRINSGGETVVVNDSIQYQADTLFVGNGKPFVNTKITDILETTQDAIYKTERSTNKSKQSFGYDIPVSSGEYEVNLHFAEIYWGATGGGASGEGKRIFSVLIEGEEVLTDFDLSVAASPMTAIVKKYSTTVVDGELNISFSATVDQPKVSALEIFGEGMPVTPEECTWNELAESSLSKVEAQSVKVNDKLYVMAGFLANLKITPTTEIYNPANNSWSSGAPMPNAVTHMGAVAVGNEIWILAGFEGNHPGVATDKVQIYNTVTDTWSEGPALPSSRASGAATYNNGKIHYFGGLMPDRKTNVAEHLVLDVSDVSAGWVVAADLPNPRNHLSAATVNGKVYAIGGQYGHDAGVKDQKFLDEYDPATDSWSRKADLPSARSHFEPGTIVHNNKIIIVGGRRGNFFFDDVTEYDVATDTWSERCKLPSKLLAPSAEVFGDRLIVANGGENGTCCPKNNTFSMLIEPEEVVEQEQEVRVLVYHETGEFRHSSIQAGIDMVNEFGNELDWVVADSQTSDVFTSENLANYDVVIWMSTTGDNILTTAEQSAFENFIQNGGGYVGVHSATDTYRSGSWSWYNDLAGAIVQVSPYHTSNNFNATIDVVGDHASVAHLGAAEWNKNDEYYYWELNGGYLFDGNINLLQVRATGVNSYDAARPVTWYKEYDGGRSFYTALGHHAKDYQSDINFRTMMKEAIIWAADGGELKIVEEEEEEETDLADTATENSVIKIFPNPVIDILNIDAAAFSGVSEGVIYVFGMDGNIVSYKKVSSADNQINLSELPSGYYIASVKIGTTSERHLIYKQ